MNVFDQPDNFPPILFHAWEYLKINGPMQRTELERLLAPSSFAPTAHANVKSTLSLGIRIHIFEGDSNLIGNSRLTDLCNDFNSFRRTVRDIYFDQKTNSYDDLKNHTGNLQLAAAWFLSFPFEKSPGTWEQAEKELPKDFSSEHTHWPILNDTQWVVFERWMRFLGLGVQGIGRNSIVLQPCINEVVWDVVLDLPNNSRTTVKDFVEKLTTRFPSLPGGVVYNDLPPDVLSRLSTQNTSLIAQALRDVSNQGLVELESGVDVSDREVFEVDAGEFNFDFLVKGKKK
jgi:hypothetical protein